MSDAFAYAGLRPAHHGYEHQDVCTAILLALCVVHGEGPVLVDRKVVQGDRFDDVGLIRRGRRARVQFKASLNVEARITRQTFDTVAGGLRFDRLVATYLKSPVPADEYRLCVTWAEPEATDQLAQLLEPVCGDSLLEGVHPRLYKIRGETLWPADGVPLWPCLSQSPAKDEPSITRLDVLTFCSRFIIELGVPAASTSLDTPGPLESVLLSILSQRIGIGRYPNQKREPRDVAALLIRMAKLARGGNPELTPDAVIGALQIRTDFGRVAQEFPLDPAVAIDLPTTEELIARSAVNGLHQLVIASPGSGKSWLLTRVAERLTREGVLVARHYCHLDPGDTRRADRVTIDALFGNLRAELVDAAPELADASQSRYSAGIRELQETLGAVEASGRKAVLIVDGLDHIARVRQTERHIAESDADIISQLCALDCPPGVTLVVGSQPGAQIEPLRTRWHQKVVECVVPPWTQSEVSELSGKLGFPLGTQLAEFENAGEDLGLAELLWERSEGNPLYATYLIKSLITGQETNPKADARALLRDAPTIEGDISKYYRYLTVSHAQAGVIADILGVLDFAVTKTELAEIVTAPFNAHVERELKLFAPVLVNNVGHGGIRIFHESFRRFMVAELEARDGQVGPALGPIITWLNNRGLFRDARAYRFLIPALQRAGRDGEALKLLTPDFVSSTIEQAHPHQALELNLVHAAHIAARNQDWPALATCVELRRAADTSYFDSNLLHDPLYWRSFIAMFGTKALSERLLFEGRPTQERDAGLVACSLVAESGVVAPWLEYLRLPTRSRDDEYVSREDDPDRPLDPEERRSLLEMSGGLRIEGARGVGLSVRFLRANGKRLRPRYLREIGTMLFLSGGADLLRVVMQRTSRGRAKAARLEQRVLIHFHLALAQAYRSTGSTAKAVEAAQYAASLARDPKVAALCAAYGARIDPTVRSSVNPAMFKIGLRSDEHRPSASSLRRWFAAVRLRADDSALMASERTRVDGEGWYRCFLRFVISLAGVEAERRNGNVSSTKASFAELLVDTRRFAGNPRSCDLYSIQYLIHDVFEWALGLVSSHDDWLDAVSTLIKVSESTSSYLSREESGPLPTDMLLDLLLPHLHNPAACEVVRAAISAAVERAEDTGLHYPVHAHLALQLTLALAARGDVSNARSASRSTWQHMGRTRTTRCLM